LRGNTAAETSKKGDGQKHPNILIFGSGGGCTVVLKSGVHEQVSIYGKHSRRGHAAFGFIPSWQIAKLHSQMAAMAS
jgi:hypothetical protein